MEFKWSIVETTKIKQQQNTKYFILHNQNLKYMKQLETLISTSDLPILATFNS